jgi:hypothetical protein
MCKTVLRVLTGGLLPALLSGGKKSSGGAAAATDANGAPVREGGGEFMFGAEGLQNLTNKKRGRGAVKGASTDVATLGVKLGG